MGHMLRKAPYRFWLLIVLLALIAVSAIGVKYPADFVWEHVLTAAALVSLLWLEVKGGPLSNVSYTLIFMYLAVHVLGAHYTYSEVPYDEWSRDVFGTSVSEFFGQDRERNHFDRFVHLIFGVLLLHPIRELIERPMTLRPVHAALVAALIVIAFGDLYEVLEWGYAEIAGQEAAEHYNGQQGDVFDPQKDMLLNAIGAFIGAALSLWIAPKQHRT